MGWGDSELAKSLQAQLQAPLLATLKPVAIHVQSIVKETKTARAVLPENIGDLFEAPTPSLLLLRLTKDYAKSADAGSDALPPPVATALYFSAIAAAIVRHNSRLTSMGVPDLKDGLQWVVDQSWVDKAPRKLAKEALNVLDRRGESGRNQPQFTNHHSRLAGRDDPGAVPQQK